MRTIRVLKFVGSLAIASLAFGLPLCASGAGPAAQGTSAPPVIADAVPGGNICMGGGVTDYQGEPSVAVNPADATQVLVGASSLSNYNAVVVPNLLLPKFFVSTDSGSTWSQSDAPWPQNGPSSGYEYGRHVSTAWGPSNTLYAAYAVYESSQPPNVPVNPTSSAVVVVRSTDGGSTWTVLGGAPVFNGLGGSSIVGRVMIAVDNSSGQNYSHTGRVYAIWERNHTEYAAYYDGSSWHTVQAEDTNHTNQDFGGDVAVGPDGTVYAVWNRGQTSSGDAIVFSKSTDGGASWLASPTVIPVTLSLSSDSSNSHYLKPGAQNEVGINALASLSVDTDSSSSYVGKIYVAYTDYGSGVQLPSEDTDIFLVSSSNGGANWSSAQRINDDGSTGATQFFPWVSVDPSTGYVALSWYDTRNSYVDTTIDPNGTRTQVQVFFTFSADGGTSFVPDVQVTQESDQFSNDNVAYSDENSNVNYFPDPTQYGTYAQVAAGGGYAWAVWTDTRQYFPLDNLNPDIEEAAAARIAMCVTPSAPVSLAAVRGAGDNEIDLSWSPGAGTPLDATYNVYRAYGSCTPSSYTLLASGVTGTSYADTSASGGTEYAYAVTAVNPLGGCESDKSACAQSAEPATGSCTAPPAFDGLASVTADSSAGCTLNLAWNAASSRCGDGVEYNIYRSTAPFSPSPSTLLVSGLTGTAFSDTTALSPGVPYYYIVRAVDVGNGAEDPNTVMRVAAPSKTFYETFEESSGEPDAGGTWTHEALSGEDLWVQSTDGFPHSASHTFYARDVEHLNDDVLVTPSFAVTSSTVLTFYHTYQLDDGYDGAVIEISTDGGGTWNDLGSYITQGGYNGTIPSDFGNPIGGRSAWTGGTLGTETQVVVDLSSFAGLTAQVRFRLACDTEVGEAGWYIDDVAVSNGATPCQPYVRAVPDGKWVSGTPASAAKSNSDGSTIALTWDTTTCPADSAFSNYNVYFGNDSGLSTYTLTGSDCNIGTSGSYSWTTPPAAPGPGQFIWWVIVGTDNNQTEGTWGKDSSGTERHPTASGQCGYTQKGVEAVCP
ncbi:MAG: hypothetical protein P8018_00785 [Acidobacteriota bacterium]